MSHKTDILIIGAGAAEGAIDAANILKPLLARGEVQVIGATTLNEYREFKSNDFPIIRVWLVDLVNDYSKVINDTEEDVSYIKSNDTD